MNFVNSLTQTCSESFFKFVDSEVSKNLFDHTARWIQQLPKAIHQSPLLTFAICGIANVVFLKVGDIFATKLDHYLDTTKGSKTRLGTYLGYGTIVALNVALSKVINDSLGKLALTGVLFCVLLLRKKRLYDQEKEFLIQKLKEKEALEEKEMSLKTSKNEFLEEKTTFELKKTSLQLLVDEANKTAKKQSDTIGEMVEKSKLVQSDLEKNQLVNAALTQKLAQTSKTLKERELFILGLEKKIEFEKNALVSLQASHTLLIDEANQKADLLSDALVQITEERNALQQKCEELVLEDEILSQKFIALGKMVQEQIHVIEENYAEIRYLKEQHNKIVNDQIEGIKKRIFTQLKGKFLAVINLQDQWIKENFGNISNCGIERARDQLIQYLSSPRI